MDLDKINRRELIGAAMACGALAAAPGRASAKRQAQTRIQSLVEQLRKESGLPALGAAIVTSSGLRALAVSGRRIWPNGPMVTPLDRWHLGSCTKAITATLAARLIDQNKLQWNSTIGEILPIAMHPKWKGVPLIWLLCHRSGASMNFDQAIWERMVARGGSLRDQRAYFAREGLAIAPELEPGSATSYSNAGYMIAGAMIEQATGRAWEDLVKIEVFGKLGMRSSGFGPPGTAGGNDQPRGHNRGEDGNWRPVPDGPGSDNPQATGPAGTAHASLSDWARFAAIHLRGFQGGHPYLSAAAWQALHTPGAPGWEFTPGWKVDRSAPADDLMLSHLGSNGFWVAQATLYPGRDRAVLAVSNLADDVAEPVFSRLAKDLGEMPLTP